MARKSLGSLVGKDADTPAPTAGEPSGPNDERMRRDVPPHY